MTKLHCKNLVFNSLQQLTLFCTNVTKPCILGNLMTNTKLNVALFRDLSLRLFLVKDGAKAHKKSSHVIPLNCLSRLSLKWKVYKRL